MSSFEDPADRVSVVQLNSELQQAHLELLSAHGATHQLRLRLLRRRTGPFRTARRAAEISAGRQRPRRVLRIN